jgi:predicted acetyltransferase
LANADVVLDASVLGSAYLGGPSFTHLAVAGQVGADARSLRKADLMFGSDAVPWCSTEF